MFTHHLLATYYKKAYIRQQHALLTVQIICSDIKAIKFTLSSIGCTSFSKHFLASKVQRL